MILAIIVGGIIGYERELKGHGAGFRTHIIVCVSATLITLVQIYATKWSIEAGLENPEIGAIVKTDLTRLIAQIISGIGFLGAGTIMITRSNVYGLTTASSIWAIAALGISIGMGLYFLTFFGCLIVYIVLKLFKKRPRKDVVKQLALKCKNYEQTSEFINQIFKEHDITIVDVELQRDLYQHENIFTVRYVISFSEHFYYKNLVDHLFKHENIFYVSTIK